MVGLWGSGSEPANGEVHALCRLVRGAGAPLDSAARKESSMPKAVIFDLDGTLIDSVDLHALAWHEAMANFGHDVSFEQARSQIGKGGDKLLPVFLSEDERRDHGKELEEWRGNRFKTKY